MKNKTLIIFGMILLAVVLVTAVGIISNNIGVSKERYTALNNANMLSYQVTDYQEGTQIRRYIYKDGAIWKGKAVNLTYCGVCNIEIECNNWEEKQVNLFADQVIYQNNKANVVLKNGTTTITQK